MTDLHPVKTETFDPHAGINVDPKGFTRKVDSYTDAGTALYMARGADHKNFGYLESWLLPELNLRFNVFHYRAESGIPDGIYIDIADISEEDGVWRTRDLYVDLFLHDGKPVEVLDIDELAAATSAHYITAEEAELAIETTLRAVEGITRHGDDPMAWLESLGVNISWANKDDITLTPASV
ncbi:hypothetical protein HMPREF1219_00233 [Corynebacterium pyruviciproducens ATCC BAA-1742]|uniref:DUF402 domain-containing protein n=1 Tax=Corynebacterium pyruviciproducens ATCC BAA-1742 TaxID=1125779 RepID=S2Z2E4_9CORY|nr:DUF402 domain-containing protein [Corynebacterium pyruviciproducens]EPD70938.1 hypothetical protein HMPREF1219_00233 [Corynebacterium pyruviciproducens ATCC BAA-1742]